MKLPRIALSIRAQLLLVLTVFLALPWLGVEYVRELERVLRDAQERTLAGTAQAVATALHDRPRLFALPPDPIASFARERGNDRADAGGSLPPSASPEIAQIIEGLSRTTARIWVDRPRRHGARARRLAEAAAAAGAARIVLGAHRARDRRPPLPAGARPAVRGFQRRRRHPGRAARPRRRGRARRHPHDRSPADVGRQGGDRQRRASGVGRRPGARRRGRGGNRQRGAGRAQSRVRAAVQHRARRPAGRFARADRVRDLAVGAHPPAARRCGARDRRAGARPGAARELRRRR